MHTRRSSRPQASRTLCVARVSAAVVLWLFASPARAQPGEEDVVEDAVPTSSSSEPEDESDRLDDDAPPPDEAARITEPPRNRAEGLLWVPRVIMFVPRWVVWGVFTPMRLSLVALQRNSVRARFIDLFFNDSGTFGVLPVLRLERFQGAFVGGRIVYLDLFGAGGALSLRAGVGDRLRQHHRISLDTGRLLGSRTVVHGWFEYRLRPRENFAGIGNPDIVSIENASMLPTRLDATRLEDVGVISRFREDRLEWGVLAERSISDTIALQVGHEMMRKTFDDAILMREPYLTTVYDPSTLTAFETGFLQSYVEVAFVHSSLRSSSRWVPAATPSRGWRVRGYHGLAHVLVPGGSYRRSGIDIARFFDLYRGDRVLRLRLKLDLVQGSYEQIPFSELASLGGAEFLRGYRQDLFRDRLAGLASSEYFFPVDRRLSAYLFVDVGRVYGGLHDLSLQGLRVGFGGGLQVHQGGLFISRIQIASSVDGELLFHLRFEPTFSLREYL